jgi:segregation and condensation protein B
MKTMRELSQRIEALLFLAGEAVSKKELIRLTQEPIASVTAALGELKEMLRDHGLAIVETDTHIQLTTGQTVSSFVAQFLEDVETTLSAAAAETLALVGYRGPITRYEIEAIRGVDSRRIIRQLVLRGLIRPAAARDRQRRYVVTEDFLAHLGITRQDELPAFNELSSHEKVLAVLKDLEGHHDPD